jgi:hypothetical protein
MDLSKSTFEIYTVPESPCVGTDVIEFFDITPDKEHLDKAIEAFTEVAKNLGIIK